MPRPIAEICTALVALIAFADTHASLLGDSVDCSSSVAVFDCTPSTATVTAATSEFQLIADFNPNVAFEVDLDANTILVRFVGIGSTAGGFPTLTLSDLDWVGHPGEFITGITNFTTTVSFRIDASDISVSAHAVDILMDDSQWSTDEFLSFDLVTARGAAPEPPVLALLLFGLAARAYHRQR